MTKEQEIAKQILGKLMSYKNPLPITFEEFGLLKDIINKPQPTKEVAEAIERIITTANNECDIRLSGDDDLVRNFINQSHQE